MILYYLMPKKFQWIFLLIVSYGFYLFSGVKPLIFILSTTLTTYLGARWMEHNKEISAKKSEAKQKNKKVLLLLVLFNFGILAMLKYYNFFAGQMNSHFSLFAYDTKLPLVNIILPLGVSFYTFQAVGYCIDVYRNKYHAEENLARYALFISFFPQIVQGPISRYDNLGKALKEYHYFDYKEFTFGVQLMLWGFFKKLVIADRAGTFVNTVFSDYGKFDGLQTFAAMALYAIQIYTDFSGGIDIARGAAQMMGIDLIENFERPYFATSVSEHWRRWHMSLTNWMKDYVFFPLTLSKTASKLGKWGRKHMKGSMIGKQLPTYIPTFTTFFLIGIWHGASWGFIAYGLYNATIIVLSMILTPAYKAGYKFFHINVNSFLWKLWGMVRTFLIMMVGRTIVRAATVHQAFAMAGRAVHLFDFSNLTARLTGCGLTGRGMLVLFCAMLILLAVSIFQENKGSLREAMAQWALPVRWLALLAILAIVLVFGLYGEGYSAANFVYRNF
ncbi:MAG: MBOAT family protein [Eubacteriales bacterium]|nr:MBOAT family protein [Eubacteriales bacterium]